MSDFLSNFSGDKYEHTRQEKKMVKESKNKRSNEEEEPIQPEKEQEIVTKKKRIIGPKNTQSSDIESTKEKASTVNRTRVNEDRAANEEIFAKKKKTFLSSKKPISDTETIEVNEDELIIKDTGYKRKKRMKGIFIGILIIIVIIAFLFGYYQLTHVKVPNFEGKELSEARLWTAENGVELEVDQKYSFEKEINIVLSQNMKNQKIKKGNKLKIESSLGPNPDELFNLPDFEQMKIADAQKWIKDQKATNITIIEEYSETISAGDYLKFELVTKDVKLEDYKRKDKAKLYYSKGKETYEKNISMPDFIGKTKEEVSDWAKKNELSVTFEESDSDTVAVGKVISQSIVKDTKVAKKDTFSANISKGKAIIVDDFSQVPLTEVESKTTDVTVQTKQIYSDTIPYGQFISQSIEAGQKFSGSGEKPIVQVVYSIGRPYIKDLCNNTLEGDLQKIFYDEYQSKGANITYQVYYIDSAITKGTVIKMSKFNEFSPTTATIQIGISKGNLQSEERKETGSN